MRACALSLVALAATGCGLLLDAGPPTDGLDAGPTLDAGARVDAGARADAGSPADTGVPTPDAGADAGLLDGCGDGMVDRAAGEQCEGETATCVGCRLTCCPEGAFPCADLFCDDQGVCAATPMGDDIPCVNADGSEGECRGGVCGAVGCGDGILDSDEVCDDGNAIDDDGCPSDCLAECSSDGDCPAPVACQPGRGCDVEIGVCELGPVVPATVCEACIDGESVRVDDDGDGYPAASPATCTDEVDCNDGDPTIYPGAPEIAGDGVDQDCNGSDLFVTGTDPIECGEDADGDGVPVDVQIVAGPECEDDRVRVGRDAEGDPILDCDDDDPRVSQRQILFFDVPRCPDESCSPAYDYDCDGVEEPRWPALADCRSNLLSCRGAGWLGEVPACGEEGRWAFCEPAPIIFCAQRVIMRRQQCR